MFVSFYVPRVCMPVCLSWFVRVSPPMVAFLCCFVSLFPRVRMHVCFVVALVLVCVCCFIVLVCMYVCLSCVCLCCFCLFVLFGPRVCMSGCGLCCFLSSVCMYVLFAVPRACIYVFVFVSSWSHVCTCFSSLYVCVRE